MRKIIGITGLIGSGKSTAASRLYGLGYTRVRFASPLKAMMACLGLTDEEIEGANKETPCAILGGKTPRFAMQTIGTEWGRQTIDENLWINAWAATVGRLPEHIPVVCEDVRFSNEANTVRRLGGRIVRIIRAGQAAGAHPSELMPFAADITIANDGTIEDLHDRVAELTA